MAADVFGFYTIVAMGLFTVLSIILGYVLMSSAVVNAARGSAYYAYTRISEAIGNSMYSGTSSVVNINLYPKYVIFSAYFDSLEDLEYNTMEGMKMFSYGVNQDEYNQILRDIVASATGYSYSNANDPLRVELNKCVGDVCLCFGEMESALKLEPEYYKPLACADICWGEFPGEYTNYVSARSDDKPREILLSANTHFSQGSYSSSKCAACVNYVNNGNYNIYTSQGYNVILTGYTDGNNINKFSTLRDFSHATKYSFIPNVIECRTMDEIASASGKRMADNSPHLFFFEATSQQKGLFSLLNVDDEALIIKVLSLEYVEESITNRLKSVVKTSFIKAEPLSQDTIIGGQ